MDRLLRRSEVLLALTVVVLSLIIGLINPTFFTIGNVFDLLRSSIVIGIFAMGVLIVLVSGGIDLSFMAIGIFALTWTEVSLTSVAGLLTVMGYSTNDTVIVFDRIRENQAKLKDKRIDRIIDISINEMLVRTILTSSTVFATTLIMNIFGTGDVRNFAFAMNIGVIVGTYSSIFLATPIFMWISRKWYSGPPKKRAAPPPVVQAEE